MQKVKPIRWIDGIAAGAKNLAQFFAPTVGSSQGFGLDLPALLFAAFSSTKCWSSVEY